MNGFLIYIFQVSICQTGFYLLYRFYFRKLTFFHENRIYLLLTTFFSFIIPLMKIRIWENGSLQQTIAYPFYNLSFRQAASISEPLGYHSLVDSIYGNTEIILFGIYVIGCLYFLIKFLKGLWKISMIIHKEQAIDKGSYKLIQTESGPSYCSFLHYIFINSNQHNISDEELSCVIAHEKIHIHQRHSIDVVFMEIVNIVCWFNPIVHQIKKALRQTHEYIADQSVVGTAFSIDQYSRLLLKLASTSKIISFTHQFSMISIKNRIIMLNQLKRKNMKTIKFLMTIPVIILLMVMFSCIEKNEVKNSENSSVNGVESDLKIGKISWEGNTHFSDAMLTRMLGIQEGGLYIKENIEQRLMYHPDGDDIGSLYMDNGYLYFSIKPEEENVGKTVNLNFKINEGNTATIDKIIITGNTNVAKSKVLDMVNLKSGELFSRSKLIQSQKNIAESGLFKSDEVGINPMPHEDDFSRVDIEFILVEL